MPVDKKNNWETLLNTFGIEPVNKQLTDTDKNEFIKQLKIILTHRIQQLISKDFSHLINILYRIDVDEKKVKKVLAENFPEDASLLLAELIIERQMQKIITRNQYKKNK